MIKKRDERQISNIRHKGRNVILFTFIKRIRKHYEQLYDNILTIYIKLITKRKLPKLTQEKINNYCLISIEKIKIIKTFHETPSLSGFNKEIIQMAYKTFEKDEEEAFSKSFYKAAITLLPKAGNTLQEKEYTNHCLS